LSGRTNKELKRNVIYGIFTENMGKFEKASARFKNSGGIK